MEEVRGLTEAMTRLDEAQARTEAELQETRRALRQLARQCETLVCDIEEIAYIMLHDALRREFGWQVGVLERTCQQWNGESEEINVFGRATDRVIHRGAIAGCIIAVGDVDGAKAAQGVRDSIPTISPAIKYSRAIVNGVSHY